MAGYEPNVRRLEFFYVRYYLFGADSYFAWANGRRAQALFLLKIYRQIEEGWQYARTWPERSFR